MAAIPLDLLDRIRTLERQVRELTGRSQMRPALNEILHGDIVLGEGGQLIAQTPEGQTTFVVGQTPQGDWGIGLARDDGSRALTVGDDVSARGQMVRLFSRDNHVIMMDDAYADGYLGRPWVPVPLAGPVTFTATDDTPLHSGFVLVQHKVLRVNIQVSAPAGTSAEFTMRLNNVQYGPTWTVTTTALNSNYDDRVVLPAADFQHGDDVTVVMFGRRTAGTGTCSLRVRGVWGTNTITPEEADQ